MLEASMNARCVAKPRVMPSTFERAQACLVELLDLTIADPRWSKRRINKLRQLRQIIFDELEKGVQPPRDLHKYFLLAGVWANQQRAQERNRQLAIADRK